MMDLAIYLKKYEHITEELVFLSPCIAKRLEINLALCLQESKQAPQAIQAFISTSTLFCFATFAVNIGQVLIHLLQPTQFSS